MSANPDVDSYLQSFSSNTFSAFENQESEPGHSKIPPQTCHQPSAIVESCRSLVSYEESSGSVRFVHHTAQKFLKENPWILPEVKEPAKTILTYLSFDAQSEVGLTALHRACSHGYLDVVRRMLQGGANTTIKDRYGQTSLDYALIWGSLRDWELIDKLWWVFSWFLWPASYFHVSSRDLLF